MPIPDRSKIGFSKEYQILATKTKILLSEGISVRMRLLLDGFLVEWELTLDKVWKEFLLNSTLSLSADFYL